MVPLIRLGVDEEGSRLESGTDVTTALGQSSWRPPPLMSLALAIKLTDSKNCEAKSPQPPFAKGGPVLPLCKGGLRGISTPAWFLATFSN